MNFLNTQGDKPINIKYEFVVGYSINISDIRATNVPATTVCALYHKNAKGDYNTNDFGIYEQETASNTQYLSAKMFYNEGDKDSEVFGICRQIKLNGSDMSDECHVDSQQVTPAREIKLPGKLNAGEPLKQMAANIGKLTFC